MPIERSDLTSTVQTFGGDLNSSSYLGKKRFPVTCHFYLFLAYTRDRILSSTTRDSSALVYIYLYSFLQVVCCSTGCSVSNCFIWKCDCNETIRHLDQQMWFLCCHELDILISILSLPQKIWEIMKNYQNFQKNDNFNNFFVKHFFQFFHP